MRVTERHTIEIRHEAHPEDNVTIVVADYDWTDSIQQAADDGLVDLTDSDSIYHWIDRED